jgi:uncharacterized SAM-binding protein YcdF (DUF218 family)
MAARILIVEDQTAPSDAILVLAGNRIERVYEAGSLYRERLAPKILLSKPSSAENVELARTLGVKIPSHNDVQRMALEQMGVPSSAIENMEAPMFSTRDEARVLARLATARQYRSVIVATSPYHSRRARMYMRREAEGRFDIRIRPTRYESIDPDKWWWRPYDRVDVVLEWLKLPRVVWTSFRR